MAQTITVASWNTKRALSRNLSESPVRSLLSAVTDNGVPDVLLLQEVPRAAASGRLREKPERLGLEFCLAPEPVPMAPNRAEKDYVNLTASRWPLRRGVWDDPSPAPLPESLLATEVEWPRFDQLRLPWAPDVQRRRGYSSSSVRLKSRVNPNAA